MRKVVEERDDECGFSERRRWRVSLAYVSLIHYIFSHRARVKSRKALIIMSDCMHEIAATPSTVQFPVAFAAFEPSAPMVRRPS